MVYLIELFFLPNPVPAVFTAAEAIPPSVEAAASPAAASVAVEDKIEKLLRIHF